MGWLPARGVGGSNDCDTHRAIRCVPALCTQITVLGINKVAVLPPRY